MVANEYLQIINEIKVENHLINNLIVLKQN